MSSDTSSSALRQLPSVGALLKTAEIGNLLELYGRPLVVVQVREVLDEFRKRLMDGAEIDMSAAQGELGALVAESLAKRYGKPQERVLNATGVFLHTNLGRAPLPAQVAASLPSLLSAYCDLEFDLSSGQRSDRNERAASLLAAATGAPAALVVNNNAAAMVLVLATLAVDRQVVISRGELVEIGGSFRIPDLLEATGAELVEVGTTNRTVLADYEKAVTDRTALLLKVYPSNYRQSGYVSSVSPEELVSLGGSINIPVLVDEGSGLLRPHPSRQLRDHPSLSDLVAAGCDLACGSGDKLLGGPQAGLLVGGAELIGRCRHHPMYRAVRPDRAALAGLEGVLRLHLKGEELPLDRLWPDPEEHRVRLEAVREALGRSVPVKVVPAEAFVGGGAAPDEPIPGEALALEGSARLQELLRKGHPPVVGYSRKGRLILDLRTVAARDDAAIVAAVSAACENLSH